MFGVMGVCGPFFLIYPSRGPSTQLLSAVDADPGYTTRFAVVARTRYKILVLHTRDTCGRALGCRREWLP